MVTTIIIFVLFSILAVQVKSQICHEVSQYDRCSTNSACSCLHMPGSDDSGICGFRYGDCSELVPCELPNNHCYEPYHVCVDHPRCHKHPVCYPMSMTDERICPPIRKMNNTATTITTTQEPDFPINIPSNTRWKQNGVTIVGGNGQGNAFNQLNIPFGLYVDDDETIYVADYWNNHIMKWKNGATSGEVVAGGNGQGDRTNQLYRPTDVFVDKETDSLIICDNGNRRVMKWSRQSNTINGEIIIEHILCYGLTMDNQGFLYIVDTENHEVRRYRMGETQGTVVAGGNGNGNRLNQLDFPRYIFVDQDQSVYVTDWNNHRVMKWVKDAKEGIVVAGGRGLGNSLTQLSRPQGVFVDQLGTVYVADYGNNRVVRWNKGMTEGDVVAGGNGLGPKDNQLNYPVGLSFDRHGNLYVVDSNNYRIQRFSIEKTTN